MNRYIAKNGSFDIIVREQVKEKLLRIDASLRVRGYYLALKIGYRPLEVQEALLVQILDYFAQKNIKDGTNLSEKEVYDLTIQMISDPATSTSPHITGGAIDVALYTADGDLVDM
jgi:D-alanyl-D-alanine dipeptidase